MKVIVDTSVWSAVLRRNKPDQNLTEAVSELVKEGRLLMVGPIRQELLSGIREAEQFERLREKLSVFPDLSLQTSHFEMAAKFFNKCRAKGVQGSHIDFLICSVCASERAAILTTDNDFFEYAKYLGIQLFHP